MVINQKNGVSVKKIRVGNRLVAPSKIVCVGRNYVDHIKELHNEIPEDMVVFVKPNTAISEVLHSYHKEQLHYEGELCFLYEKGGFSAVGFGLDLTKRELQSKLKSKGLPWERAKAFDGAAVFSQFVEISGINPNISFELHINNKMIQSAHLDLMIYKPDEILTELSTFMKLCEGDIVMTGTPKGVGPVNEGDLFAGEVKDGDKIIIRAEWLATL